MFVDLAAVEVLFSLLPLLILIESSSSEEVIPRRPGDSSSRGPVLQGNRRTALSLGVLLPETYVKKVSTGKWSLSTVFKRTFDEFWRLNRQFCSLCAISTTTPAYSRGTTSIWSTRTHSAKPPLEWRWAILASFYLLLGNFLDSEKFVIFKKRIIIFW